MHIYMTYFIQIYISASCKKSFCTSGERCRSESLQQEVDMRSGGIRTCPWRIDMKPYLMVENTDSDDISNSSFTFLRRSLGFSEWKLGL